MKSLVRCPFPFGADDGCEKSLQTARVLTLLCFVGAVCCRALLGGVQIPVTRSKRKRAPYEASHKDVYQIVGVDVLGDPQQTNFGRDIVFSADLCYNDIGDKNG